MLPKSFNQDENKVMWLENQCFGCFIKGQQLWENVKNSPLISTALKLDEFFVST
jgi:hypothetical protein